MSEPVSPAKRGSPSQLGAHISGFPAVVISMAMSKVGPKLLRAIEVDIARGRAEPRELEETRRAWAAVREAAQAHLNWRSSRSSQPFCSPVEGPSESGLTVKQAATRLGVSRTRVYQLLAEGRLQGTKDAGGRWLVDELAVELRKAG